MQQQELQRKLEGRVSIITGSGSGMGKAMALLFAVAGAKVVVTDVVAPKIKETVEEIEKEGGVAIGVLCDVSKQEDVDSLFKQVLEKYGTVDILVNNAGIMDSYVPCVDVTDELWEKVMAVNATALMRTMRKAIPIFLENGKGAIVNLASVGGMNGGRAGIAYTASKHAVVGMTKNVAFHYGDKIRCNAIAPGPVQTGIEIKNPHPLGAGKMHLGTSLIKRLGQPGELANAALFLASDDSSFVNGTVLTVDGGWTTY